MKKVIVVLISLSLGVKAWGSYFNTLPKGVRALVYHHARTNEIQGRYTETGSYNNYDIAADITGDSLRGINSAIDLYLDGLSSEQYENFSLGSYQGSAQVEVIVNALGVGYGLTDKLTTYFFTPHYKANVKVDVKRTKGSNYADMDASVNIDGIPDIDNRMIQSVIVNYYGYRPLGTWSANDFGDTELGFMYRPTSAKRWGILLDFGVIAPTGRRDDPDILQDFGFGDGQWDLFLEAGSGLVAWDFLNLDGWVRYTYQLPFINTIRMPEDPEFPITARKGRAEIKLGNKFSGNVMGSFILNSIFSMSVQYMFDYKQEDNYTSAYSDSDSYWESNTESVGHSYKVTLETTSVKLFQKKIFAVPLTIYTSYQKNFSGKNTPRVGRFDLEFRLFF
jgi:hypothetical protein